MDKKKRRLGQFNDLVDRVERAARSFGDDLFHSSEAWVWYKTQTALNVILATFAIASIGFIVSSVLGACYAMGWHLGVKESIAGVIVIGLAVDYTIHLGHMYDHARALGTRDREAKFEYAMRTMGETVVAGAITTAGSYCSTDCQRIDWRDRGHRKACKKIRDERAAEAARAEAPTPRRRSRSTAPRPGRHAGEVVARASP
ncbi:hypothetical protein JL720_7453 [Aureococcus anophagefferens]|nr:hypothetical protein JL720_7453 [Aureococcus anophagefferens]